MSTATLQGSRVLHTLPGGKILFPSRKMKRCPLKPCQFCGREFGSASIAIHKEQCREKLQLKHNKGLVPQYTRGQVLRPNFGGAILNNRDTITEFNALNAAQRHEVDLKAWQPFSGARACQFCGERHRKHSLSIHEQQCCQKQLFPPEDVRHSSRSKPRRVTHSHYGGKGAVSKSLDGRIGLNSPQELVLLPERPKTRTLVCSSLPANISERPKTRTLERSSLPTDISERPKTRTLERSSLPTIAHEVPSEGITTTYSTAVCVICGRDVPSDRISVHQRTCKAPTHTVNTSLTFPTLHQMTVKSDSSLRANRAVDSVEIRKVRKPPTVICYVCGREYGTKSISIHEPQCLRKWQISNSKLPISQRKPVPKKPSGKTRVARVAILTREEVKVSGGSSQQPPEEVIERYFQHCYAEFEDELIPCAKCGRTFAPERHVKHTRNCNAEPLKSYKRMS